MKLASLVGRYRRSMSGSLFVKIFFVCTFVSLFLILSLGVYTHFYILKNLDTEIEKYEQKKLNELLNISKTLFGEMEKITTNYASNVKFTELAYIPRESLSRYYSQIQNNQAIMSSTVNSSNYIENIFIYYEKGQFVVDFSGVMDLNYYYDTGWLDTYNTMENSSMILDTRKVKKRNSTFADDFTNIITFIAKIPYSGDQKEGAVILNVNSAIISDLLKSITADDERTFTLLVNDEGTILASGKEDYYFKNISELVKYPADGILEKGSYKFTADNTKMVAYYETFPINNWKLFYIESENAVFQKSSYIRSITFIISLSLLLLSAIVSFLFSLKVYNPIKNIVTSIKRMTAYNIENGSDVSFISGSLNHLLENNKLLENQLKQNDLIMREIFLSQLIRGELFNQNEIMEKADYYSIGLDADYYKVAILQRNSLLSPLDMQNLELYKVYVINLVINVFKQIDIEAICTQGSSDNILVLLKLSSVKDVNETDAIIEQVLEDIRDTIQDQLNVQVSIGVGRLYSELSNVGVSCSEANEALRYKFLIEDQAVINYSDISSGKDVLYYPAKSEQQLISFVQMSDTDKTMLCLNDMIDDIMKRNKNFKHVEVCLTNMIGIIRRCLYELDLNEQEVFGDDPITNVSIESFGNIQHFADWIGARFRKIIDYRIERQKDDAYGFVTEVKEYIEKVYREEISLDTVSNHFNYNSSYFSKIFKEKLGVTFWEYVAKVRIEKSKELLVSCDDTIEQIAARVGYNNRFSYIRTFKKYTGITPGEYRMNFSRHHTP